MIIGATPEGKKALAEAHTGQESIQFVGHELFLYYPSGIGRSKLTNALIESKLKMSGTARNANTLKKLILFGVLAVVALGLYLSKNKASISPECPT